MNANPSVVVAGEALVDLVISLDGSVEAALGGAPYNTARAAARLGAHVGFAGTLSHDRFGSRLAARLATDGVAVLSDRCHEPTTLAAAELDEGGAASYRFYIAGTSAPRLDTIDTAGADVLFTGGLGLVLEPMASTVEQSIEAIDETTMVMIDVNCRPNIIDDRGRYLSRLYAVLRRSDVVKVSDDDLAYLSPGSDTASAASDLLDRGARAVLVTAGASHTSVLVDGERVDVAVPALTTPLVDTIGAGDTFGGALLAWWTAAGLGRSDVDLSHLQRAVAAAHTAAGWVVTRRGADPPTRADLPADWT